MEKIYQHSQFDSTPPFPLQEYFSSYEVTAELERDPNEGDNYTERSVIFNWLGVQMSSKQQKDIEKRCSSQNLKNPGDHEPEDFKDHQREAFIVLDNPIEITDQARELEAVKLRERAQKRVDYLYYRTYFGKEPYNDIQEKKRNTLDRIIPGSDFIITVRIYRPFVFKYHQRNFSNRLKLSHEILALGSNRLTELRDVIDCKLDDRLCKEVTGKPADMTIQRAKDVYPSNFLFIENVFYNDLRCANSVDYSVKIREWAQLKGIDGLTTADMDSCFIKDLKPRLGYPYVFVHQGDCEHLVVFSDARLVTDRDRSCPFDYPYVSLMKRRNSSLCNVCGSVSAQWICAHSKRLPYEYMPMCHTCFVSYNYINEERVGKFKAYPIFGLEIRM